MVYINFSIYMLTMSQNNVYPAPFVPNKNESWLTDDDYIALERRIYMEKKREYMIEKFRQQIGLGKSEILKK